MLPNLAKLGNQFNIKKIVLKMSFLKMGKYFLPLFTFYLIIF